MPRVKGIPGPYHFFFFSFDCSERPHVHVRREIMHCKFWLDPVELAANHHFSARELNVIRSYIEQHRSRITEAWDEHCR